MSRTKSLALAMYLGAALAGGAVALAADRMTTSNSPAPAPDQRNRRERFFEQLKLTASQRDSAAAIMDERNRKSKALYEQYKLVLDPVRAQQDTIFAEADHRLSRLLTPEQKAIYDQMQQNQRSREKAQRSGEKRQ